jgi:topoisomerase IA-like protein
VLPKTQQAGFMRALRSYAEALDKMDQAAAAPKKKAARKATRKKTTARKTTKRKAKRRTKRR